MLPLDVRPHLLICNHSKLLALALIEVVFLLYIYLHSIPLEILIDHKFFHSLEYLN